MKNYTPKTFKQFWDFECLFSIHESLLLTRPWPQNGFKCTLLFDTAIVSPDSLSEYLAKFTQPHQGWIKHSVKGGLSPNSSPYIIRQWLLENILN